MADINECTTNGHNCIDHNETCMNTQGSFQCTGMFIKSIIFQGFIVWLDMIELVTDYATLVHQPFSFFSFILFSLLLFFLLLCFSISILRLIYILRAVLFSVSLFSISFSFFYSLASTNNNITKTFFLYHCFRFGKSFKQHYYKSYSGTTHWTAVCCCMSWVMLLGNILFGVQNSKAAHLILIPPITNFILYQLCSHHWYYIFWVLSQSPLACIFSWLLAISLGFCDWMIWHHFPCSIIFLDISKLNLHM